METMIQIQNHNSPFSLHYFQELAKVHDVDCISLYIPTHRTGKQWEEGRIRLKNQLKEVTRLLKASKRTDAEIKELLQPATELLEDINFWGNQSEGLALFLSKTDGMHQFKMPIRFEPNVYVSNHFYLLPMVSFFNGNGDFYVLTLSQQHAYLYQANRDSMKEISIQENIPQSIERTGAYGDPQQHLQFRSGGSHDNGAIYHGQGGGKDNHQQDLVEYFRAIDSVVHETLNDKEAPLVLVCQEMHYPVYKSVTACNNLFGKFVSVNPQPLSGKLLHEYAWKVIKDYFDKPKAEQLNRFGELANSPKVSNNLGEIIPGAIEGRVDTLFILKGAEVYGTYDQTKGKVVIAPEKNRTATALINLAAVKSFETGADVFILSADEMPVEGTEINAILRY